MSSFLSTITHKRKRSPSILDTINVKRPFLDGQSSHLSNSNEKYLELIATKTELAKLKTIFHSTQTDLMSSKVEYEKALTTHRIENQALTEKVESLKDKLNCSRLSIENLQCELNESRDETTSARLNSSVVGSNSTISNLRDTELLKELDEKRDTISTLERNLLKEQNNCNVLHDRLKEAEGTLKLRAKNLEEYKLFFNEKKEQLEQYNKLSTEVETLRRQIKDFNDDKVYVETMKKKLVDYPELKEQNQILVRENKRLKSIRQNIHLLEQENMEYKKKENAFKSATIKCHELELVNEELKQKLDKWQAQIPNPDDVLYNLSRIQRENLILSKSEADTKQLYLSLQQKLEAKAHEVDTLILKVDSHSECNNSLQKTNKMLSATIDLLQTERDDYKDLLDAYLARQCLDEVHLYSANPLAKRCFVAEKGLSERTEMCRQQKEVITKLEQNYQSIIGRLEQIAGHYNSGLLDQSSTSIPASPDSKVSLELRSRIVDYEGQLQILKTKLLLLENKPVMVDNSSLIQPALLEKDCQTSLVNVMHSFIQTDISGRDTSNHQVEQPVEAHQSESEESTGRPGTDRDDSEENLSGKENYNDTLETCADEAMQVDRNDAEMSIDDTPGVDDNIQSDIAADRSCGTQELVIDQPDIAADRSCGTQELVVDQPDIAADRSCGTHEPVIDKRDDAANPKMNQRTSSSSEIRVSPNDNHRLSDTNSIMNIHDDIGRQTRSDSQVRPLDASNDAAVVGMSTIESRVPTSNPETSPSGRITSNSDNKAPSHHGDPAVGDEMMNDTLSDENLSEYFESEETSGDSDVVEISSNDSEDLEEDSTGISDYSIHEEYNYSGSENDGDSISN